MKTFILILFVVLFVGGIASAFAWFHARDEQVASDNIANAALARTLATNESMRNNSIEITERYYHSDLETEDRIYDIDLRGARTTTDEQLVKTAHEAKLLRMQMKHDQDIAEAWRKYPAQK